MGKTLRALTFMSANVDTSVMGIQRENLAPQSSSFETIMITLAEPGGGADHRSTGAGPIGTAEPRCWDTVRQFRN